jgi:succinylglutamic semialdehyde dehydrogenase
MNPANLIANRWHTIPGDALRSTNPARPDHTVWSGAPSLAHVDLAVAAARAAQPAWSRWGLSRRAAVLRRFQSLAAASVDELTTLIRDEVGKVAWDAKAEAQLLATKVDITLDPDGALKRATDDDLTLSPSRAGRCSFRPHGVMAVLGPFNFPAHLPNGHIVPALLLGNTIVFKPSDKAPAVGQFLANLFHQALEAEGAPPGVFNLIQGAAPIAASLAAHSDIDGVLFTGSWPVGRRIMQANLDRPGRILALEMGGSNAAVVMDDANLQQAAVEVVRCAFIGSGQRCTCTRRVIVHEAIANDFRRALGRLASSLIIGPPDAPHPVFMGPVISQTARDEIVGASEAMARAGGRTLAACRALDRPGWYVSPGIVEVDGFSLGDDLAADAGADVEVFGPLLRMCVVKNLDDAMAQANTTRFGLAASIFTQSEASIDRFVHEAKAGCINVNAGTAGASGKLPFGGLGLSGNHRPAGAFSVDYCAYPVASMIERGAGFLTHPGMQTEL